MLKKITSFITVEEPCDQKPGAQFFPVGCVPVEHPMLAPHMHFVAKGNSFLAANA
jgi:hypothetical protein